MKVFTQKYRHQSNGTWNNSRSTKDIVWTMTSGRIYVYRKSIICVYCFLVFDRKECFFIDGFLITVYWYVLLIDSCILFPSYTRFIHFMFNLIFIKTMNILFGNCSQTWSQDTTYSIFFPCFWENLIFKMGAILLLAYSWFYLYLLIKWIFIRQDEQLLSGNGKIPLPKK